MELNYDSMMKFIQDYFPDFVKYGQNPAEKHRLYDYFAEDFEFYPNYVGVEPVKGREIFLTQMSSHPSSREEMEPEDIFIDEKRKVAVTLLNARIVDSKTGEVLVKKKYCPCYYLGLDKNDTIKINKIVFFWEQLAPGARDVLDVFMRDGKPQVG